VNCQTVYLLKLLYLRLVHHTKSDAIGTHAKADYCKESTEDRHCYPIAVDNSDSVAFVVKEPSKDGKDED
jgi:hypothetical protein